MLFARPVKKSSGVPIVPMIDILFILLIFFIVSTNFNRPRHQLQISLPTAKDLPTQKVIAEMSVLAIDGSGTIALEGALVPDDLLISYLEAWRKLNPERNLEIELDQKAPSGKLIEVMGALTRLGIKTMPTRVLKAPSTPLPTPNP